MMDIHLQQKSTEKVADNKHGEGLPAKEQRPISPAASPPSASSSPSHDFSFTISLHSSATTTILDKTKAPSPFAIDLSPADDIFFHGHLLPLHLLAHLPVPPRSSTNSLDSFTLPIRELIDEQRPHEYSSNTDINNKNDKSINSETRGRNKAKSFSLFGLGRWRKGCEAKEGEEKEKHKKKLRLDLSNALKRYVRMVSPLLFFKRGENLPMGRRPYSFSDNLSSRNKKELRGRRGEFSAPASMRTSPSNSGLLVATTSISSSTSDSTMEELQAAIQAAIAHCKNSIAVEDKLKC